MNAKAIRAIALIVGLIFLHELTQRISDTKYRLLASLLFAVTIFAIIFVRHLREGTSRGKPRLGILKAFTYITFVIFNALLSGWVMYFYGDTVSAVTFALVDTVFFFSTLYLLHVLFKKLYERQKKYLANDTPTQPGGAPDAAPPRR